MITTVVNDQTTVKVIVTNAGEPPLTTLPATRPVPQQKLKAGQIIALAAAQIFSLGHILGRRVAGPGEALKQFSWREHINKTAGGENALVEGSIDLFKHLNETYPAIAAGAIVENDVSGFPSCFGSNDMPDVTCVSKAMPAGETLFVYNACNCEAREAFVKLNASPINKQPSMVALYGYESYSSVPVYSTTISRLRVPYIKLYLKPLQLIILKTS